MLCYILCSTVNDPLTTVFIYLNQTVHPKMKIHSSTHLLSASQQNSIEVLKRHYLHLYFSQNLLQMRCANAFS